MPPAIRRSFIPPSYPSSSTITTATTATGTLDADMSVLRVLSKKFPCANCSSAFTRKGGLTYHQKFECGQKPRFNCPYCIYRAGHISNARRHVRKCHPGRDVYTIDLKQRDP
ncbi:hypothetical protein P5V15_004070 [Pogonomyrmex californicus]